jgi:hypothetical protein
VGTRIVQSDSVTMLLIPTMNRIEAQRLAEVREHDSVMSSHVELGQLGTQAAGMAAGYLPYYDRVSPDKMT